jgi:hypothetical protein
MWQKIKQAFCWLIAKAKAGAGWVWDNRPWLKQQARGLTRQVQKVLMLGYRQVWATYDRGRALAILTVQYRQTGDTTFRQALEQAKAEVRSMSEAEIAYFVVNFFTELDEAQVVNAAA